MKRWREKCQKIRKEKRKERKGIKLGYQSRRILDSNQIREVESRDRRKGYRQKVEGRGNRLGGQKWRGSQFEEAVDLFCFCFLVQGFNFLFAESSSGDASSGQSRFLSCSSSRPKLGPFCTAGVGKVRGLGRRLESGPERPKPHSGKKLEGDGRRASDTKRLGRAEIGVSIVLDALPLVVDVFPLYPLPCDWVTGGGGRANGFGGPWAPALRIAPAEGEGGGKTTLPGGGLSPPFTPVVLLPAESREDDSPVASPVASPALPTSELSLGICTFNCGRLDGS